MRWKNPSGCLCFFDLFGFFDPCDELFASAEVERVRFVTDCEGVFSRSESCRAMRANAAEALLKI
jgi:hypothetical protein